MNWHHIDTAPKDGTCVLLSWGCKAIPPLVAFFGIYHVNSPGKRCWRDAQDGRKLSDPVRWCAIPDLE